MAALTFTTLELAPESEATKLSEPFTILHVGTFKRPDFPKDGISVSAADLDQAVENFNDVFAPSGGIPVDQDHAFAEGREAPALGWIRQMWRDGDDLKVRAEWNDAGARLIASKSYPLISPEFSTAWKDEQGDARGFTVLAAGLTSRPFLKSLPPVSLSDGARSMLAQQAAAITSLTGPFTYANASGANYTITFTGTADTSNVPVPKDAPDMSESTVTAKQVADLETAMSEVRSTVETLKTENETLSERADAAEQRADATEKELSTERLNAVLSQARREGRIDAKDETTSEFAELAEKIGLDGVKTILAKIPAETIPVSEQGHGRDKPITASDAPEGVDPESHALHLRTEEIAAEQNIPYEQAASLAFKEAQV